jgi:acetyl esterase
MSADQRTRNTVDKMELHPEIAAYLRAMRDAGFPAMDSLTPVQLRSIIEGAPRAPGPEVANVQDREIEVAGGTIRLRVYQPEGEPQAIIEFMHGGGWTIGSIKQSDAACRHFARNTRCIVVSVDYRLAPEHPFPTAVDDCFAALQWIAFHKPELAGERDLPLIVAGDSAGANLSAVLCLLARDAAGPKISAQILLGPSTDGDIDAPELAAFESPFLNIQEIAWFFDQYVPNRLQRGDFRMSPMRAVSHAGLPPAFIATAEHDILRVHGEAYGRRLTEAGVPAMVCRYPGTTHSFVVVNGEFERSREAYSDIAAFIRGFAGRGRR